MRTRRGDTSNVEVLIFEPEYAGHHLPWVAFIAEAFLSRGDRVSVATSTQALMRPEYHEYLECLRGRIELVPMTGWAPRAAIWHHRMRHLFNAINLVRAVHRRQPDLVFVPYLDAMLIPLGVLQLLGLGLDARRRIDVLLARGEFAYPEIRTTAAWRFHPKWRFKEWVVRKAMRAGWFSRVLVVDEITHRHMQGWQRGRTVLQLCADPVEASFPERNLARRELGLDEKVKIVGCWGLIDGRKGIDLLLHAFSARPPRPDERLLLAGKQDARVRTLWSALLAQDRSLAERVITLDRFVSPAEMRRCVAAVDVAAVVYPAHVGSSRVLLEAAAAGKPVLGSQFGLVGQLIRENRLGYCCDVRSSEELAQGLDWAFTLPSVDREAARKLAQRNSVAEFKRRVLNDPPRAGTNDEATVTSAPPV